MSEFEEMLASAVLRKRGQGYHDFEVGETIHHTALQHSTLLHGSATQYIITRL